MDRDTIEPNVGNGRANAEAWVEYYQTHAAPNTHVYDTVWDVEAPATGPFFTDVDGNVLMDFTSQVAAVPLGFNNPHVLERMGEFDLEIDPLKIAGSAYYAGQSGSPGDASLPTPGRLMEELLDVTTHYDMEAVFLSNSGAEAVENAMKICYHNGGHRAATFQNAFHGRTLGALSLNRSKQVHRRGYPEVPGVISVPYCTCEDACTCGWQTDGPGGNALSDQLDPDQGALDPEELAFIVLEPVQGEGGYRIPNDEFVADVAEIRDTHDVLVISDEIQAGLGRTGEMWGVDHLDLTPDVITCAKGLRVGATISRRDVFPTERSRIASTWGGGDLIHSLQGFLTLEVIREQNLLENVRRRGQQLCDRLRELDVSGITDVRGRGLMIGVEFETKAQRDAVNQENFERGLLTLGCGYKTLRLLPPLDSTEREIDLAADILAESIEATAAEAVPR